jgi:predicted transcriptional regulator
MGSMLSHPFPVDRLRYLRDWANSSEYHQIRQGNYQQASQEGAVEVPSEPSRDEAERLQRQIEELQQEINRIKSRSQNS